MTKQSQTHADAAAEAPNVDLLRRRFKLQDEYIESIRKDNTRAGVPAKYMDNLIQWRGLESMERKRVEDFIAKATDKKRPGHWWQISDLKARGLIPEDEVNEYENKTYPFRQVNSITKIKTPDGRFFLRRFETWFALDAKGEEIHRSFDFLDYYSIPKEGKGIEYDRRPADPQNPEGPSVRVKIVSNPDNHENNLVKEYITPWSKEKFDEILSYSVNDDGNRPTLVLVHPRYTNPVSATYEQMLAPNEDFDSTFEKIRAPPPKFEDWHRELNKRIQTAQDENPYG